MIRKKVKNLIAKLVVSTMIFTIMPISAFAQTNNAEVANTMVKVSMPTVSPTPQDAKSIGAGFIVTNKVNIIGADLADEDAKRELLLALKKLDIKINESYIETDTTIIIGEKDDDIDAMDQVLANAQVESIDKNEGYVLVSKKAEDGKSVIAIEGKDEVGTFYGVKTLKQILVNGKTDVEIPEVSIKDYPTQHIRAVVEGFYGNPWTQEDRLDQFKFYGENKMNMYMYAPKDDPYHRDKWRDPYPVEEMVRMQELINTAAENKVDFVFAISPGKDIDINSEADYQALVAKCESLYDMGVRSFAILWDDIFTDDGAGQAAIMNRFNKEFVKAKEGVKPLITVPTQYWGSSMFNNGEVKPYTKGFAENLDKDIEVMWTGEDVIPESVTLDNAEKINNLYGRKMILWWNYPVSDYNVNKLALGPIYNLPNDLDSKIGGFIINPMEFSQASKISVHTGADYAWNTGAYDLEKAWSNAIEKVVGSELKDSFRIFAEHSTRLDTGRPDAPEMRELMDQFWAKVDKKQIPASEVENLKIDFANVKAAVADIKEKLYPEMLEEVSPQLDKFSNYADAATVAADMVIAMLNGDSKVWWDLKANLTLEIAKLDASKAQISNAVLDDFVRSANSKTDEMYFDSIVKEDVKTYEYEATVSSNIAPLAFTEWYNGKLPYDIANMFDGKLDTAYRSTGNVKAGDEIVVDLGTAEKIDNIYMLMGRTSSDNMVMIGNLEISNDGVEWKTIKLNNSFREVFVGDLNESARYIRYIATEDQENQVFVREFMVNKNTNSSARNTAEGNVEYIKELVDGKEVNSVVAKDTLKLKEGDNIGLELVDYRFITEVEVNSEAKGIVEYTINGMDWFELGNNNEENIIKLDKPQVVKQVRFVSKEEKELKKFDMNVTIEGRANQTVETNRKGRENYADPNIIANGDLDDSFISGGQLKVGDYAKLDLGEVTNVRNLQYVSDRVFEGDRIREGKIEYSLDGENWTEVYSGNISSIFKMHDLDFNARYLKITATNYTDSWFRMSDFSVNNPEAEVIFQSTVKPLDDDHRLNNLMDGNIQTSFIPRGDVKTGDNIVYNIFDGELINKVEIFQSEQTISNAKAVARTVENELIELGRLDKGYNVFSLENPEEIRSISIEFEDGMGKPEIYEIVTENFNVQAVRDVAKKNIEEAKGLLTNTEGKSDEVVEVLNTSITQLESVLIDGGSREDIFKLNKKLEKAMKEYIEYKNPEEPKDPSNPEEPKDPSNPEEPKDPSNPEEPKDPSNPGDSAKPEKPGKSNKPGNSGKLPNTGAPISPNVFGGLGLALTAIGASIFKRKRNK